MDLHTCKENPVQICCQVLLLHGKTLLSIQRQCPYYFFVKGTSSLKGLEQGKCINYFQAFYQVPKHTTLVALSVGTQILSESQAKHGGIALGLLALARLKQEDNPQLQDQLGLHKPAAVYSEIYTGVYSEIYSGVYSEIYSGVYSEILSQKIEMSK